MFYGYDPTFSFLLLIPAMLLAMYAQNRVAATYARYIQRPATSGATGSQVARGLLDRAGLSQVPVEVSQGRLTDHYDPRRKALRLSQDNYARSSLAAVAIAAHEVGHAVQHAEAYGPLAIRNNLVPVVNLTSTLAWPLFFVGFILSRPALIDIGIWLFVGAVVFQVLTLPVEFNASSRAIAMLQDGGYLSSGTEVSAARDMLGAAALTYVAAMAVAVSQLLRMLLLRNRRR